MATKEDTWATNIKKELQERPRNPNRDDLDQFEQQDGLLLRNNLIYVPEGLIRLKILRECHDNTLAGHFGMARTHELVSKDLLVAQNEQAATGVCQVLWYMCSIQGSQASPVWTPTASVDS